LRAKSGCKSIETVERLSVLTMPPIGTVAGAPTDASTPSQGDVRADGKAHEPLHIKSARVRKEMGRRGEF
jgi:hypothetical protein